ncbi:hypothetical protein AX16_006585 [Volvariella volvacea WC 439]|nr:hypothetical protein AX16_006585 [Volvariella volvacea WC 439]
MAIEQDGKDSTSQLAVLVAALLEQKPYSGVVPVPPESLYIFHGADNDFRRLNLGTATGEDLESLFLSRIRPQQESGSAPATSDHSAILPTSHFLPTLDLHDLGILPALRTELLGTNYTGSFSIKPRSLNLYGSGYSGESARSSPSPYTLIIIFPSPHTGGAITVHSSNKHWVLDTDTIAHGERRRVGYIAFPSNLTYDISPIFSGNLVTLTYDIYPKTELAPSLTPVQTGSSIPQILSNLLSDPTFLPSGGYLGFHLANSYPLVQEINNITEMSERMRRLRSKTLNHDVLKSFGSFLVGQDSVIYYSCRALGLEAFVGVAYRTRKATIMCDHIVDFGCEEIREEEDILLQSGGIIIEIADHYHDYFEYRRDRSGKIPGSHVVHWVLPPGPGSPAKNKIVTPYLSSKDRRRLASIDAEVCLMVEVGAYEMRTLGITTPTPSESECSSPQSLRSVDSFNDGLDLSCRRGDMAHGSGDVPVGANSYDTSSRSLNPQQLWAHILKKDRNTAPALTSQESGTLSGSSTASSGTGPNSFNIPLAPIDKAATSMRILLHDTQINFEKFSSRVDTLINHVSQAKQKIHVANDLAKRGQDKFSNQIYDTASRTRVEIQNALGSPAQAEKLEILTKDLCNWFQSTEKRLDAMHLLNQTLVQSIQTQLQAMQTIQEQQGATLTALMPLQPLLQSIPTHIDNARTDIMDTISKTVSHRSTQPCGPIKVEKGIQFQGQPSPPPPRSISATPLKTKKRRIEEAYTDSPLSRRLSNRAPSIHQSPTTLKIKTPTSLNRLASTTPSIVSRAPSQVTTPRRPLTDIPIPFFNNGRNPSIGDGTTNQRTATKSHSAFVTKDVTAAPVRNRALSQAFRRVDTIISENKGPSHVTRTGTVLVPSTPPTPRFDPTVREKENATSDPQKPRPLSQILTRSSKQAIQPNQSMTNPTILNQYRTPNLPMSAKRKRDRRSPPRDGRRFIPLVDSDDDSDE